MTERDEEARRNARRRRIAEALIASDLRKRQRREADRALLGSAPTDAPDAADPAQDAPPDRLDEDADA